MEWHSGYSTLLIGFPWQIKEEDHDDHNLLLPVHIY